ncbi:MAG: GDP-mannose 4,6-dehydratase [Anaerolineae bacterium]
MYSDSCSIVGNERRTILRALVTGVGGFAGSHLAEYLLGLEGMQVYGVVRPGGDTRNIAAILSQMDLHREDLADRHDVRALIEAVRPDYLFHLAAQASVGRAWDDPGATLSNNIVIEANLLQALVDLEQRPRVLIVGSSDVYGRVRPEEVPVSEDVPLRPVNPYAVSKIAQEYLGYQYYLSHGLHVIRVRPFNHIGPRQGVGFVVPDFSRQIALIEAGLQEPLLRVGNLSAQRDFTDVRDMVRAYHLALEHGRPDRVYNLGSGRGISIRDLLDRLLAQSRVPIQVEADPARMRPSDVPIIVADSRRFQRDTGWAPGCNIDETLRDVMAYWRERVQEAGMSA